MQVNGLPKLIHANVCVILIISECVMCAIFKPIIIKKTTNKFIYAFNGVYNTILFARTPSFHMRRSCCLSKPLIFTSFLLYINSILRAGHNRYFGTNTKTPIDKHIYGDGHTYNGRNSWFCRISTHIQRSVHNLVSVWYVLLIFNSNKQTIIHADNDSTIHKHRMEMWYFHFCVVSGQ